MNNLDGNTRFLADQLLHSRSMYKWTRDVFLKMKAEVASGSMDEAEELDLFRDSVTDINPQGFLGPLHLASIDWQALFDLCLTQVNLSERDVNFEISIINSTRAKILQGSSPKPLKQVLSGEEFEIYFKKLAEQEFGRSFRRHRLDDTLALMDWWDRNRGPFSSIELPREIKSVVGAKSGEYLASVWLQTLHLRYPTGVPWHRGIKN
jgi:hypothetical protein